MGGLKAAFGLWADNQGSGPSLILKSRHRHHHSYVMADITTSLRIVVTSHTLSVVVVHAGQCWDLLLDLDVVPVRIGSQYQCKHCRLDGSSESYPNRKALWKDHILDPFRNWLLEKLCPARYLNLWGKPGSSTWATLSEDPDPGCQFQIPIRDG